MIFHASIAADDPRHTAEAIAALWGGRAYPFPAIALGSWMAMAGDDRGSAVEVLPRGAELHRRPGAPVTTRHGPAPRHGPIHLLVASPLGEAEILAIADGYGFPAHKGGPMWWGQAIGLSRVADLAARLAEEIGPRWAPAALLLDRARSGCGW